jgi:hypothetical protein
MWRLCISIISGYYEFLLERAFSTFYEHLLYQGYIAYKQDFGSEIIKTKTSIVKQVIEWDRHEQDVRNISGSDV